MFGNKMKILLTITTLLLSNITMYAQSSDLGKRTLPTLSVSAAIDKAEKYISEKQIDISNKFLSEIKFHEMGPWTEPNPTLKTSGPYWQITYEKDTFVDGGQDFILVYMDGKIRHVGGR